MADEPSLADLRKDLAAMRANDAPVIFFEAVTSFGISEGVANMTLECASHFMHDGQNRGVNRVQASLRLPVSAVRNMRDVLDKILLMANPAASKEKN